MSLKISLLALLLAQVLAAISTPAASPTPVAGPPSAATQTPTTSPSPVTSPSPTASPIPVASSTSATTESSVALNLAENPLFGFLTAIITFMTSVIALIGGWRLIVKNQTDIYKHQVDSLRDAHELKVRSMEILLDKKESELRNLEAKINSLEGFCAVHFPDISEGNSTLEKLSLLLSHIDSKVNDDKISEEIEKMKKYLESQLSLVDRQVLSHKASRWLTKELNKGDIINDAATFYADHLAIASASDRRNILTEAKEDIRKCLIKLSTILNSGVSIQSNNVFVSSVQIDCDGKYTSSLEYLRDNYTRGQMDYEVHHELREAIDLLTKLMNQ